MARKIRLTRPELKRQRDLLSRFERYLPMLKLKQQQLQATMRDLMQQRRAAEKEVEKSRRRVEPYRPLLADLAGVDVEGLSEPEEVRTDTENIAGVRLPIYREVVFPPIRYSLFATPPWVDRMLTDMRGLSERREELRILERRYELLEAELTKIIQRVNLFEKVMIPRTREAIRRIRIHLGDQMTAAVARGKIAKAKLAETTGSGTTEDYVAHDG